MSDKSFIDTNILVYAFDKSEKQKHATAKTIIKDITKGNLTGVISNQVLGELFTVLTRKIEKPLTKENAQTIINGFIDSVHWNKINYTAQTVSKAIETSITEKTHFWDLLITETMIENKVSTIITENTEHFKAGHIKAINPFKS